MSKPNTHIPPAYIAELKATCVCYEGAEQFIDPIPYPADAPETCRYYYEEMK